LKIRVIFYFYYILSNQIWNYKFNKKKKFFWAHVRFFIQFDPLCGVALNATHSDWYLGVLSTVQALFVLQQRYSILQRYYNVVILQKILPQFCCYFSVLYGIIYKICPYIFIYFCMCRKNKNWKIIRRIIFALYFL